MKIKNLSDIPSIGSYLTRIGAEPRSLRTAVVKEQNGKYWKDIAVITISAEGEIKAPARFAPSEAEIVAIASDCEGAEWPQLKLLFRLGELPNELKAADPEDVFVFKNEHGHISMIQQKIERKDGEKSYIPWTFWDDSEWRRMEPEGKLPLWGLENVKDNTTVFIHEGAKAARTIARMVSKSTRQEKADFSAHPWSDELSRSVHVGWIGGALSPSRTDWSALKRLGVKRVYIVSDNDEPGVAAVPSISFQLRLPTFHVQFTNEWPGGFDLADDFPSQMFKTIDQTTHYVGPPFRSCVHPATWATDLFPPENGRGRGTTVLRDDFKRIWAYVEEADVFVCTEMPEIMRTEAVMNKMLAGFSHTNNTSQLMVRAYRGRKSKLCYRPDIDGRVVTDRTTSAINLHTPTTVKKIDGDASPWSDFLKYMFPIERERIGVERWCSTLISQTGVRMEYGLLLVSERQGVGKTTLGARILAPLVGDTNAGFPSESDIINPFNGWVANKRLVVIGEIYSGHSWRAYNQLKGYITDKDIEVNQKYMRPYRIENWAHVLACSNSRKALRMEKQDRRWFYPQVTEAPWPREKFAKFNEWLMSGGLQIIHNWAYEYGDYVTVGERAPMTEMKRELIESSRSEPQQEFSSMCEALTEEKAEIAFAMKDVIAWLRSKFGNRIFDSDYDLRKVAVEKGFFVFSKRIKFGGRMQYVLMSPAMVEADRSLVDAKGDSDQITSIRKFIKHPDELIQDDM